MTDELCNQNCAQVEKSTNIHGVKKKKNETNNQNQVKPEKSQTSAYFQEHKSNPEILLFSATVTAVYGIGKILFGKVSSAGLETVL